MSPLGSLKIGAIVGIAALIAVVAWYVGDLRTQVADAEASIAAKDATITEQAAAAKLNLQAIADLQAAKDRAEAALTADAGRQQAIVQTVHSVERKDYSCPGWFGPLSRR